jgi:hypothetical protein
MPFLFLPCTAAAGRQQQQRLIIVSASILHTRRRRTRRTGAGEAAPYGVVDVCHRWLWKLLLLLRRLRRWLSLSLRLVRAVAVVVGVVQQLLWWVSGLPFFFIPFRARDDDDGVGVGLSQQRQLLLLVLRCDCCRTGGEIPPPPPAASSTVILVVWNEGNEKVRPCVRARAGLCFSFPFRGIQ